MRKCAKYKSMLIFSSTHPRKMCGIRCTVPLSRNVGLIDRYLSLSHSVIVVAACLSTSTGRVHQRNIF